MNPLTHVFVTVPVGRLVPVPASEARAVGAVVLLCEPGKVYALPWSTYTRRRLKTGDFILSNQGGTAVKDAESARASSTIKIAADGAIDSDQRTDAQINAEASQKVGASPKSFDHSDAKQGKA